MDVKEVTDNILEKAENIDISVINLSLGLDTKKGIKNFIHDFLIKKELKKKAKELSNHDSSGETNDIDKLSSADSILIDYDKRIETEKKVEVYRKALTDAENNISKYISSLENFKSSFEVDDISELKGLAETKDLIQAKTTTMFEKKNSRLRFQEKHKLDIEADYPESKVLFWGILFIVLILESIANSYFYAQGSDLGLLGGVLQAFLVSITNVVMSFGIGFILFRYTNHISIFKKIIAWIGITLSFFMISFLHLITAHYREILIKYPDDSVKNVIYETWNNPFNLSDFDSFILIVIGYAISIFIVLKSYKYDDRYPHYGQIDREYKLAKTQLEELEKNENEKFKTLTTALLENYKMIKDIDFNTESEVIRDNLSEIENKRDSLKLFIENIDKKCLAYLILFRDEYNDGMDTNNKLKINKEELKQYIKKEISSSRIKVLDDQNIKNNIDRKNTEAEALYTEIKDIKTTRIKDFESNIEKQKNAHKELYTHEEKLNYKKNAIKHMKDHNITCYLNTDEELQA